MTNPFQFGVIVDNEFFTDRIDGLGRKGQHGEQKTGDCT